MFKWKRNIYYKRSLDNAKENSYFMNFFADLLLKYNADVIIIEADYVCMYENKVSFRCTNKDYKKIKNEILKNKNLASVKFH